MSFNKSIYRLTPLCLTVFLLTIQLNALGGKELRRKTSPQLDSDSSGTQNIAVKIGDGSGSGEEIMLESLLFIPHSEDFYSVYNAFIGVYFDNFYGEVQQSRFIDGSYSNDGELTASITDTMDFETEIAGFRVASGKMYAPVSATTDTMIVLQTSYLRPESDDAFIILEYTVYNNSDSLFTDGKLMFFSDFDVGDAIYDNLTGKNEALNLIYQYSADDDYAGLSLIFPDTLPVEFGNYDEWFFEGSDIKIDSLAAHSFSSDTDTVYVLYDTTAEYIPDDYSSYIVVQLDTIQPWDHVVVAFALAIQSDYQMMASEIEEAKYQYNNNLYPLKADGFISPAPSSISLLRAYPNPFNSQMAITLKLNQGGSGGLEVFDILGRSVQEIYSGFLPSGEHKFIFNAGKSLGSGIYFVCAAISGEVQYRKIIYLK